MDKLKNLLFYGGIKEEEYKRIRKAIFASNRTSLLQYTAIAFVCMVIMFLISFFIPVLASSRLSFANFMITSAILFCAEKWLGKKYGVITLLSVYTFEAAILLFGIILGTYVEPNQVSASFGILMFAVPLLFIDVPGITAIEITLSIVIYVFAAKATQTGFMFGLNMSFIIPYAIIAIILCTIIMRVKVSRMILDYDNELLSHNDQLTGLCNRRCFELELNRYREGRFPDGTLVFEFDINGLKETNDSKGHKAGDEIIKAFADILKDVVGTQNKCFRTGGDEFYAIIENSGFSVDEFAKQIEAKCDEYNKNNVNTISVAIGGVKCVGMSAGEALKEADRLMYESKSMHYYNKTNLSMQTIDSAAREKLEKSFDDAIKNEEFKLYCQPKYNADNGLMTSAEALVRWIKDDGTIIRPVEFIQVFESSGQIIDLDKYMFNMVCKYQKEFIDSGITPLAISVNISRVTLYSLGIVELLCSIVDSYGIPKNLVPIEITETSAFESERFGSIVNSLKKSGFLIHMDDFGHGYSSLVSLGVLPFDVLKLDKSLVDDIGNEKCNELLKHVIELAHFLKMEVVAEGVEEESQLNFLQRLTCDTIQGYLFSKPLPFAEYKEKMLEDIKKTADNSLEDAAGIGSLRITNDLKLFYLNAMSSIYMTIHVIDLVENTTIEFATTTNVKKYASKVHNADVQMQMVMKNAVSKEYVDRVLDFVDFKTLPERIKGKRTISMDFVGVHFGWTRARFIVVNTDEQGNATTVIFTTQVVEADKVDEKDGVSICLTDETTGVYNNEAFYRDASQIDKNSCLVGTDPSILNVAVYRLDGRDEIISSGGNIAWDEVLKNAAIIVNRATGDNGRTYRFSENEFISLIYADDKKYKEIVGTIDRDAKSCLCANSRVFLLSHASVSRTEYPKDSVEQMVDAAKKRIE